MRIVPVVNPAKGPEQGVLLTCVVCDTGCMEVLE